MIRFDDNEDFEKYLDFLKCKKPFDCRYLKVLPDSVMVGCGRYYKTYENGALICSAKKIRLAGDYRTEHFHRCSLEKSTLKFNSIGELEIKCGCVDGGKLLIKIKDFRKE